MNDQQYCCYYQANIEKAKGWFFVAVLRSFENIAFDRTLDKASALFEIFVPKDCEQEFLDLMQAMMDRQIVTNLRLLPNRFNSN